MFIILEVVLNAEIKQLHLYNIQISTPSEATCVHFNKYTGDVISTLNLNKYLNNDNTKTHDISKK